MTDLTAINFEPAEDLPLTAPAVPIRLSAKTPIFTNDELEELWQRAATETILRDGDPYYSEDGEANSFERAVTPVVVQRLLAEIEAGRNALAGRLFDGESLNFREAVRTEVQQELMQSRNHHRAMGIRIAARIFGSGLRESIDRGHVCAFLTSLADEIEGK
ncbi:hypothetical protein [Arthrobacter sp. StoSoilB22]|uniref:hypothetical protein n=1 Tax=Arthrobacter sp. StoSoilB22 TaxID=2830996 RepID=UPI001CC3516D|nr:hypothetical protein [Arthrobacter sp. StoSoilB22]BCW61898.1 hypothetical protein StoSoilB22_08710 [Arthrobacter sp. StoSoilB22]